MVQRHAAWFTGAEADHGDGQAFFSVLFFFFSFFVR